MKKTSKQSQNQHDSNMKRTRDTRERHSNKRAKPAKLCWTEVVPNGESNASCDKKGWTLRTL
jgi:hypothetical protein